MRKLGLVSNIDFEKELLSLKRAKDAPHKPILLLALIRLIQSGVISDHRILITPELVMEFKALWSQLVEDPRFKPNFALPFYHLRTSRFWSLVPKAGAVFAVTSSHSIGSMSALNEALEYADLDPALYALFKAPETAKYFTDSLLKRYFPGAGGVWLMEGGTRELVQVSKEILESTPSEYRKRLESLAGRLPKEVVEEELFVRGCLFKREIPRIYGFRCAISGMQVETKNQVQLIDACHIIPFSLSKNDTISNGISLCPNLHRAFDRGLIAISKDYRVRVSKALVEQDSPFRLGQFEGKRIHLPENPSYHPAQESLAWHRDIRFLGDLPDE
jgi:putative restriction endonuclease